MGKGGMPGGMDPSQMDPKRWKQAAKQMAANCPAHGVALVCPAAYSGFGKE